MKARMAGGVAGSPRALQSSGANMRRHPLPHFPLPLPRPLLPPATRPESKYTADRGANNINQGSTVDVRWSGGRRRALARSSLRDRLAGVT